MRAVIFDMDGVLIDTERIYHACLEDAFSDLGVELDDTDRMRMRGTQYSILIPSLCAKHGLDAAEALDRFENRYRDRWESGAVLLPGAHRAIRSVRERGLLVGLATNSARTYVERFLDRTGTRDLFDTTASASDVAHPKPAPDVYLVACEHLGVEPADAIVVEDSLTGMQAANAAGCRVIGLVDAPGPAAEELCMRVIPSLEGFGAILDDISGVYMEKN